MDKILRNKIAEKLREKTRNPQVALPDGLFFSEESGILTMTFRSKSGMGLGGTPCNMQEDSAAFEGWALALYVHYLDRSGNICLEIPEDVPPASDALYMEYRHYSRFLYRVLRFSQYPWFHPSDRLRERADDFRGFLERYTFTNNVPSGPAGEKETLESIIEDYFSRDDALKKRLNANEIFRQLPVGLFRGNVARENRVFTGGASAIDLWTVSGDFLTVLELKAGGNKKMGALTELFFYANYVCDMFVKQDNRFHPNTQCGGRGYQALLSSSPKEVHAYLLLDKESLHPLITPAVLEELNWAPITYGCLMYRMDAAVTIRLQ